MIGADSLSKRLAGSYRGRRSLRGCQYSGESSILTKHYSSSCKRTLPLSFIPEVEESNWRTHIANIMNTTSCKTCVHRGRSSTMSKIFAVGMDSQSYINGYCPRTTSDMKKCKTPQKQDGGCCGFATPFAPRRNRSVHGVMETVRGELPVN